VNVVRPFRSRLVRQDRAAGTVTPLVDSQDPPSRDRPRTSVDLDAYDSTTESLYVYRQQRGTDVHVGVVCDVHHGAFDDGQVRGHESVRPDQVEALMRHFATTPARPELVALLHRAGPVLTTTVAATCETPALLRFEGPDGLEQTVWRVPDGPTTDALADELSRAVHYIADGHHRVAANLALWRASGGPSDAGVPCVVYPMDGLRLSAFHRRVTGPVDTDHLHDLLAAGFAVEETSGPAAAPGGFDVYAGGRWFRATFDRSGPDGAGGLDVALLHDRVLQPLVDRARESLAIHPVRAPLPELIAACDLDGGALFTLEPPSLDVLTAIADRAEVMPPKTTYFDPKPCAGIFLRG
jgi:uncharacterized protein (DUF1015 family)